MSASTTPSKRAAAATARSSHSGPVRTSRSPPGTRAAHRTNAQCPHAASRRHHQARARTDRPLRIRCHARAPRGRRSRTRLQGRPVAGPSRGSASVAPVPARQAFPPAAPLRHKHRFAGGGPDDRQAWMCDFTRRALTSATVSAIATGSLMPASASSSSRRASCPAPVRETAAKTAAGSVGEKAQRRSAAPASSPAQPARGLQAQRERTWRLFLRCRAQSSTELRAQSRETAGKAALQQDDNQRNGPERSRCHQDALPDATRPKARPAQGRRRRMNSGVGDPSARRRGLPPQPPHPPQNNNPPKPHKITPNLLAVLKAVGRRPPSPRPAPPARGGLGLFLVWPPGFFPDFPEGLAAVGVSGEPAQGPPASTAANIVAARKERGPPVSPSSVVRSRG